MAAHPDNEVQSALTRLLDALCARERDTGRRSVAVLEVGDGRGQAATALAVGRGVQREKQDVESGALEIQEFALPALNVRFRSIRRRGDSMRTKTFAAMVAALTLSLVFAVGCKMPEEANTTAKDEQARTEINQRGLLETQPPPRISWSLERDNLTKRFKLQNDRAVSFYMYVFIEGNSEPIGYYQINEVSSVDSQLTNPQQIVTVGGSTTRYGWEVLPSPAEDGSYGTNGDAKFGFTPEGVYIETNLKYRYCPSLKFGPPEAPESPPASSLPQFRYAPRRAARFSHRTPVLPHRLPRGCSFLRGAGGRCACQIVQKNGWRSW